MNFIRDDDDNIEILTQNDGNGHEQPSFNCQICREDFASLSVAQRQAHYDRHFHTVDLTEYNSETPRPIRDERENARHPNKRMSKVKFPKKWEARFPCKEVDVFWYNALTEPPPPNFTPGLVHILRKALCKSQSHHVTRRAALCHPSTVHIRREIWDHGWGCGYRNYLMACSALLSQQSRPEYHYLIVNSSRHPGVRDLQRLIQEAWDAGFDQEGRSQLKQLVGTRKWIGTSDLYVAFTFCGIPCELVEFNLSDSKDKSPDSLAVWVMDYFSSKAKPKPNDVNEALRGALPVTVTEHMPLILQHQGHSRTIVGYEIAKDGECNLLVFDPSFNPNARLRGAAIDSFRQIDSLKRPISECTESTTRDRNAKRPRSAFYVDESIDVDIDNPILNQTPSSLRGGTSALDKHLPSDEKLSQRLLVACRLSPKKLSKKRYQILYFPMSAPLTDKEKAARRVVTGAMVS